LTKLAYHSLKSLRMSKEVLAVYNMLGHPDENIEIIYEMI